MERFKTLLLAVGYVFVFVTAVIVTLWLVRGYHARSMPDLQVWHQYQPVNEYHADDYPAGISFESYRELEDRLFAEIQEQIYDYLPSGQSGRYNRYDRDSVIYPGNSGMRWNRSFVLQNNDPKAGVLLLHGASDSPYSIRALAELFHERGLYVLALRLPGHGTVPAGLKSVNLDDWKSVVRMGVRTVTNRIGDDGELYIVGYSVGAALALDYALDALNDNRLVAPQRLFLYSPAIGISAFARFAGWDVLLSRLPFFEKFSWISIEPEYDPYKYNSFAKNAGHITYTLLSGISRKIDELADTEQWQNMPMLFSCQSVADATVQTGAVIDSLYLRFPDNNSELVLFDINRAHELKYFVRDVEHDLLDRLSGNIMNFDYTIVTNVSEESHEVAAFRKAAGSMDRTIVRLSQEWPSGVYSLSHVSLPFSKNDAWYGIPESRNTDYTNFSTVSPRGETELITASISKLMRLRYNPFYDYLAQRTLEFCPACNPSVSD